MPTPMHRTVKHIHEQIEQVITYTDKCSHTKLYVQTVYFLYITQYIAYVYATEL